MDAFWAQNASCLVEERKYSRVTVDENTAGASMAADDPKDRQNGTSVTSGITSVVALASVMANGLSTGVLDRSSLSPTPIPRPIYPPSVSPDNFTPLYGKDEDCDGYEDNMDCSGDSSDDEFMSNESFATPKKSDEGHSDHAGVFWKMLRSSVTPKTATPKKQRRTTRRQRRGAPRLPRLEMKNRSLNEANIATVANMHNISYDLVKQSREERWELGSYEEELHWLWGKLKGSVETVNQRRSIRYKLTNGEVVTRKQFIACYDLGLNRFWELQRRALDPRIHQPKPPKIKSLPAGLRMSDTELQMAAYLECFVMLYADEQPNTGQRHLDPVKFGEIWAAYQVSCKIRGQMHHVGCKKLLNKVWLNRFLYRKDIRVRRNKGVRGGLCYDCAQIKIMGDRAKTQEEMDEFKVASEGE
jgi:hypothetical protein